MKEIFIKDFNYNLPAERIATFPLHNREDSKLLVYKRGGIEETPFKAISERIPAPASLILNDTRVIEARILFQKSTGGIIELFCLEPFAPWNIVQAMVQTEKIQWRCLIGGASKWKAGQVLEKKLKLDSHTVQLTAKYISKEANDFIVELSWNSDHPFAQIIEAAGNIPLPPYIKRSAEHSDASRYQTVFAAHKGSVAAPTAALHFSDAVFESIKGKGIDPRYITLHVGAGTFLPVKTETIADHQMHAETFTVTNDLLASLIASETIVAVGTTTLRTLESLYWLGIKLKNGHADFVLSQWEAYELQDHITYKESLTLLFEYLEKRGETALHCRTSLLIRPGYTFHSAKAIITNFHQPKSTLLLLVAAFIGEDWKKVYEHALSNNYRFLSYGDSSLLWRND
ncbi:MAG: hypothetical protein JWP69_2380 [Flaviaesturariibacter sp.]|nr:hypothetical protein [Flaviaesturariibacter sp.]